MNDDDAKELKDNMIKWANLNSFDIEELYVSSNNRDNTSPKKNDLLSRFIELQPKEIRDKIIIPLDIIELLRSN